MNINISNILFVLLFFPSVTFNIIPAEVFPWAVLFFLYHFRFDRDGFYFIFLFTTITVFILLFVNSSYDYQEITRIFGSYINPFLALFTLLRIEKFDSLHFEKTAKYLLLIFYFISVIQYLGILGPLTALFEFLIPRGASSDIGIIRGVSVFSTEPARAAVEIIVLSAIARHGVRNKLIFDIILLIFQALIIKSATGLILTLIYLQVLYLKTPIYYLVFVSISVLSIFVFGILDGIESNRAFMLIREIYEGRDETLMLLLTTSGPRLFSLVTLSELIYSHPLSLGFGNWKLTSEIATILSGIDYSQLNWFRYNEGNNFRYFRPPGLLPNLVYDFGLLAFVIGGYFVYILYKKRFFSQAIIMPSLFLFLYFFTGSPGSPIVILFIAYTIIRNNEVAYFGKK